MSSIYFSPRTVVQRPPERVAYTCDTAIYGGAPTGVVCAIYQVTVDGLVDVSATKLAGSPAVTGDVIATPRVVALDAGTTYLLEIKFVAGGNTWAPLLEIKGVLR